MPIRNLCTDEWRRIRPAHDIGTKCCGQVSHDLFRRRRTRLWITSWILALLRFQTCSAQDTVIQPKVLPELIQVGGANLQIEFEGSPLDLPNSAVEAHLRQAAEAVALFYGRFPVSNAQIVVATSSGEQGTLHGTTWGNVGGFDAVTRVQIGRHIAAQELDSDWVVTHELVHMALASLPDSQNWLEEGIATYVEPIARVEAGQIQADYIWKEMLGGMPLGEPKLGDRGLDRTRTWARTYWGGALFCLWADVEIRKKTANRKGLQDGLRGIVDSGLTLDRQSNVAQVLHAGDHATGTTILQDMYADWSVNPVSVNLGELWRQLGVSLEGSRVVFDDTAPYAGIRQAITMSQAATP